MTRLVAEKMTGAGSEVGASRQPPAMADQPLLTESAGAPQTAPAAPTPTIETYDPRSGRLLAEVPECDVPRWPPPWTGPERSPRVVRSAVAAAGHTYSPSGNACSTAPRSWSGTICDETGKQPAEAVTTELMAVCETIEWYARNGEAALRRVPVEPGTLVHKTAWKEYSPMGVIGVISPWNYPFTLSMTPLVTALFAGNTVVLKPSEVTPTVGLAIGELFGGGDPVRGPFGGIVQVVTGGAPTGEALVRSGVDKIVFTGSATTGSAVMRAAADSLTPVLLELGGKDPMIVASDADLRRAARGAVWGAFQNSGQTCMSVERVYVEEPVHDRFVELVLEEAGRIRQDDSGTGDIGSMTFAPQLDKVEAHVADALGKGATLRMGGHRLEREGLWYAPTVLTDVDHSMRVMTEETFGPVMPVMAVRDAEEALERANDSEYGLNSSVWTADRSLGESLASRLEAGNVCINDCIVSYAVTGLPFGGVKSSGMGRVHGGEGLREFCNTKSVLGQKRMPAVREPWWFPVPRGLGDMGIASLRLRFGTSVASKLRAFRRG
ncbi:MAG: aldehyde dehydrogenase family protein [Microthrixaceae bacterium]